MAARQRCIHSLRRAGDADKGGVSLFQKEIPLPYTLPEKIHIASELLEELRDSLEGDSSHSPKASGWFDGMKRFFGDI